MKRTYELSSDEVVQICTALEVYASQKEGVKAVLKKIRQRRILSDHEVELYNKCTDEIVATQQVYNKFRS